MTTWSKLAHAAGYDAQNCADYDAAVDAATPLQEHTLYDVVPVGALVRITDEYFDESATKWLPVRMGIGMMISRDWVYHRRPRAATAAAVPAVSKWSCGHKRIDADKQCPVCAFMGRRVTT